MCCMVYFFLFKQKTAVELRIIDWSSDGCSSDLITEDLSGEHEERAEHSDRSQHVRHDPAWRSRTEPIQKRTFRARQHVFLDALDELAFFTFLADRQCVG